MEQKNGQKKGRLLSLDVLRGFDMLFIMGFAGALTTTLAALGCRQEWLETQFVHVAWHGLRFEDTIFPLFLFLAGVSWPFSLAKRRANGDTNAAIVRKIVQRGLTLAVLGLLYNGLLKFDFANMVFGPVLLRIGFAWAVAATLSVFAGRRTRIGIAVAILLIHWAICVFVPAPDATSAFGIPAAEVDPLSAKGCFAGWLDRLLMPGKLTQPGIIANQGILSSFPAIVTAMLGVFAGELLQRKDLGDSRKAGCLAVGAAVLVALGVLNAYAFGPYSMPFNKILWSSSFTLVVGGYSAGMLALFYWLIDVKGWWTHVLFFKVIGMNSITIYMANRILGGFGGISKFFFGGAAGLLPELWGTALLAAGTVACEWFFLYFLYRKNTFLRV